MNSALAAARSQDRFTAANVETWRRDGVAIVGDFFTPEEVAAVQADFALVWGRTEGADEALEGELKRFNPAQFKTFDAVPFDCSPALNLIGLHPALIDFARTALETDDVRLYQNQVWAKFTGDADYDQPFHCDYRNHTLTAPSDDPRLNSITFILFFSDVSEAHGPTHYVTRPAAAAIAPPEATLSNEAAEQAQAGLAKAAHSNAGPAGSLFAYGIDIWHRGTNLTAPGGHRYAVTSCFRRADNPAIGYYAWPYHLHKPWARIFDHATPEQLTCFGVQPPGDRFWTETTLARTQLRYPGWDMTPYREAAGL